MSKQQHAAAEVSSFDYNGIKLVYESYGSGDKVVVFLHGLLLTSQINRKLARAMAERGYRVHLLELAGHGRSDKPEKASVHRMDSYGHQAVALLDHLGLEQAVLGGTSLGANVTLSAAAHSPQRLRGMVVEMPVLEFAAPIAALMFTPAMFGAHYAKPLLGLTSKLAARLPDTGWFVPDVARSSLANPPEAIVSVLHGLFVGPIAPTVEQRRLMQTPALVVGHPRDLLHPFSDAAQLAKDLPNGQLVEARSMLELRLSPQRLTPKIIDFLDALDWT